MSYILDALKKSQAEQNSEGVSLAANPVGSKKPRSRALLALVIVLVVTNIGLLLWVTLQKSESRPAVSVMPDAKQEPNTKTAQSLPSAGQGQSQSQDQDQGQSATASEQNLNLQAPAIPQPRPVSKVKKVALSELSTTEQSRFDAFNYSSHIYTDDPALCAIVINGQRLSAGEMFEGMEVIEITEEGVVFGSSRVSSQGQREQLHVAVSVIEQWDK